MGGFHNRGVPNSRLLGPLALGDVLNRPTKLYGPTAAVVNGFSPARDPKLGAVRTHCLQVELVRCSRAEGRFHVLIQLIPTLGCEEPVMILERRRWQRRIVSGHSIQFRRPGDGVGPWVPLPTTEFRQTLCFS